jgi:hypothetical protein
VAERFYLRTTPQVFTDADFRQFVVEYYEAQGCSAVPFGEFTFNSAVVVTDVNNDWLVDYSCGFPMLVTVKPIPKSIGEFYRSTARDEEFAKGLAPVIGSGSLFLLSNPGGYGLAKILEAALPVPNFHIGEGKLEGCLEHLKALPVPLSLRRRVKLEAQECEAALFISHDAKGWGYTQCFTRSFMKGVSRVILLSRIEGNLRAEVLDCASKR